MENLSKEQIVQLLAPAIGARMLTSEQREAFEQGLDLLSNVVKAKSFVKDSRRFRDYHRRVRQMVTYLQTLSSQCCIICYRQAACWPTNQAGTG